MERYIECFSYIWIVFESHVVKSTGSLKATTNCSVGRIVWTSLTFTTVPLIAYHKLGSLSLFPPFHWLSERVVSTVDSEQDGPEFNSSIWQELSVWSLCEGVLWFPPPTYVNKSATLSWSVDGFLGAPLHCIHPLLLLTGCPSYIEGWVKCRKWMSLRGQ